MRITVIGATGGTGTEVVRQALDAGHQVTAVVRDPARLSINHSALKAVTADVTVPGALRPALADCEAVISALGPRRKKDTGIASAALRSVISAMEAGDVRRLVVISASPVGPVPEGETLLYRSLALPLLRRVLREVYEDLAVMEEEIRRSATDWTIVRPPRLVDRPGTGAYQRVVGGNVPRRHTISRADLAHAMLDMLDDPATLKQAVGVAN